MISLGFDISLASCSIAVIDGERCVAATTFIPVTRHSAEFFPALAALLDRCGLTIRDVGEIVYTNGPGSFTGLKVAASIAKGFGFALGIPVYPVSTLAALALTLGDDDRPVVTLVRAKAGELFSAVFSLRRGAVHEVRPEAVLVDDDARALVRAFPGAALIGNGVADLADTIDDGYFVVPAQRSMIDAAGLRRLAAPLRGLDGATLLAIPPHYLRRTHAEDMHHAHR